LQALAAGTGEGNTPVSLAAASAGPLWPLAVYFGAVLLLVGAMLGLSYLLGQRHREQATNQPYESGIVSTGSARLRFPADFYLVAMFFVVFDLESVFVFAWAICLRDLGWAGYAEVAVFIGVLGAALAYLWRVGALEWGSSGRTRRDRMREGTAGP
jgi:NADH-quinone oxidoreductase subunit A